MAALILRDGPLKYLLSMRSYYRIHLHHTLLKAAASVLQVFGTSALPLQVTESLLSTLFIVMLKASLVVEMPISMWDNTLEVLSGCSNHPSVVKQWTVSDNVHTTTIHCQQNWFLGEILHRILQLRY